TCYRLRICKVFTSARETFDTLSLIPIIEYKYISAYTMGKTKKREAKKDKQLPKKSNHSLNPNREAGKGGNNMRDKTTIKRLLMYKGSKPKRNSQGRIVKPAIFQNRLPSGSVARVAPNRKWFGNTKVVTQNALQKFQSELGKIIRDPYQVVMKQTKLPITLLNETSKHSRVHLLETESFENTFGRKSHRKRPNVTASDLQDLLNNASNKTDLYDHTKDSDLFVEPEFPDRKLSKDILMTAGQSKRIWNELYKVIDSSDVVVQVLDSRDPMGTRSKHIENFLRKEKSHKHLVFILNKCDLVPTWITQRWVAILSQEYPTMAFHASITNPFGKGALINLLRQFGKLHQDKKQISVGFIGYPNVGKSSIINTLRSKKVCNVAPLAGETKVWQYITLMRRIYLIDCPGVVYPSGDSDTEIVLKGVVRVENVRNPDDHIAEVLNRVKSDYITKHYKIDKWKDSRDFLEQFARRSGKLLKKGEPDIVAVSKMMLNDWQRGKLPYFIKPPACDDNEAPAADAKTVVESSAKVETDGTRDEGGASEQQVTTASVDDSNQNVGDVAVKQDLSQLKVTLEYSGDDVRPLDPLPVGRSFDDEVSDLSSDEQGENVDRSADGDNLETEKVEGNSSGDGDDDCEIAETECGERIPGSKTQDNRDANKRS
ncbi:GNL2 (predicted), partial [Pycnogonum litorale]